jgi:hypothetical protein
MVDAEDADSEPFDGVRSPREPGPNTDRLMRIDEALAQGRDGVA